MKIEELYKLYSQHYLVDTDTRKIRANAIFFALKGDNFNGNAYALDAINKGASYAVIDEEEYAIEGKTILIDNVLTTLQQLANYHRNQLNTKIIGLTGSNGKTTTKELIYTVLKQKFNTKATKGNLNNHIGVPLTLLSFTPDTEFGIVEMGANHQREIAFLASITEPDFGYITNFGKAHLEGFGGIEGVIKGKSELYDFLIKNNKRIFINPEDSIQVEKTKNADTIVFKNITFLEVNPFVKLKMNKDVIINSKLIGKYNYNNIAAAITIGKYFNVSVSSIKKAIENYTPDNNRSQIIKTRENKIILDAYNANPTSVSLALENFSLIDDKNKIIVLGDMFEVGKDSLKEHQHIVNIASEMEVDEVILIGENYYKTTTECSKFLNFEEVKNYFKTKKFKNKSFLIKGSRGMALERLLECIS